MPIVCSGPVLVSRLLPLIIYHLPSSGYFEEIIRSVGGLSTDPSCGYHDLPRTLTLGIERNQDGEVFIPPSGSGAPAS